MDTLISLERAVLLAIADQVPAIAEALISQLAEVVVSDRENTGAGFYTTLSVSAGQPIVGVSSPVGDIGAKVESVEHGMGFLLWLSDNFMCRIEGYTYADNTEHLDLERLTFSEIGPRRV